MEHTTTKRRISLLGERLIELKDAPREIQRLAGGDPPHIKTVWRWVRRGLKGIKLEVSRIGGRTFTTYEALERWSVALTERAVASQEDRRLA